MPVGHSDNVPFGEIQDISYQARLETNNIFPVTNHVGDFVILGYDTVQTVQP
jgi:hypothetical protein